MRLSGFGWVHSMNSPLRLCLCLAVVGVIILGAAERTAASSATGSLPEIKVFSAEPLTLKDGGSALYTFVVLDATNIQLIEAGEIIKEINGLPSTTYKGKATGRTTYQIRTGSSNTFDTILVARNGNGKEVKTLTLSFDTKLQPKTTSLIPPVSGSASTTARTPKWGPQSSASVPSTPSDTSPASNWPPQFAKCPSGCDYCLKPEDAASHGFTQRCSEQPCYYSPDKTQNWYCYSQSATVWCCSRDGKVYQATKDQCAQAGGSGYATEAEATRACQPVGGYCCKDGQIVKATKTQCAEAGGSYWSTDQGQAMQACESPGYCCRNGQLTPATQSQCAQVGGYWYATQAEAIERCQKVTYWCCSNGQVYQTTNYTAGCYATQAEALQACKVTYWCCSNGQVYQTTNYTAGCYKTQAEAQRACQPPPTYWCCSNGQVYQSKTPGAGCYATQAEATRACQKVLTPPPIKQR